MLWAAAAQRQGQRILQNHFQASLFQFTTQRAARSPRKNTKIIVRDAVFQEMRRGDQSIIQLLPQWKPRFSVSVSLSFLLLLYGETYSLKDLAFRLKKLKKLPLLRCAPAPFQNTIRVNNRFCQASFRALP